MILRKINISQVKCNFCMEWMSLNTDVRFNINVCDHCLTQGCEDNNLRAISSQGQLYQLYMVKQNSVIESSKNERTTQNWFGDLNDDKFNAENLEANNQENEKTQLLQQIDEFRNTEIRDILSKWNILTSFLKQKQSLSNDQIGYLKTICSQKSADMKRLHQDFALGIIYQKSAQNEDIFQINLIESFLDDKQRKIESPIKKNDVFKSMIRIQDKQNFWASEHKTANSKKNLFAQKESSRFKSPQKMALKQIDLNSVDVSLWKLSGLKQNNETQSKRFNSSFYDDNLSIGSSCTKNSLYYARNSVSFSRKSTLDALTKRLNSEQAKKFQLIRNRIVKYLQKNYESNSLSRLMFSVVFEAYSNTSLVGKSLQLVSYNLSYTDFRCYLEAFDWSGIEVLKLVKTKLSDEQLKILVDFITFNNLRIKVLVLTSNKLTQMSIDHLSGQQLGSVRQIYLGKNRISKAKVRNQIVSLRNKYSLYL